MGRRNFAKGRGKRRAVFGSDVGEFPYTKLPRARNSTELIVDSPPSGST
jgi:hypothetical protein